MDLMGAGISLQASGILPLRARLLFRFSFLEPGAVFRFPEGLSEAEKIDIGPSGFSAEIQVVPSPERNEPSLGSWKTKPLTAMARAL